MIKGGKGGAKAAHSGLRFESRVAMKSLLASLPGYSVEEDIVDLNVMLPFSKHFLR